MKLFTIFIFSFLIVSCRKEAPKDNVVEHRIDSTGVLSPNDNLKLKELTSEFITATEEIIRQLESATPMEADSLYERYDTASGEIVAKLNKAEEKITFDYYHYFFDEHGSEKELPDSLHQKKYLLHQAGLELWDVGEGMAEIRPVHDFYLNIFKDKVSPDYKQYITLIAFDDSQLWAADAAVAITWEELGDRVINWEKFMKTYPNSKLLARAGIICHHYRYPYLFGLDNTSTYEYGENTLYKETVPEFERFIAKYPDSPTAALAQQMLDSNGKEGFEKIRRQLQKEYEDLYVDMD